MSSLAVEEVLLSYFCFWFRCDVDTSLWLGNFPLPIAILSWPTKWSSPT